ncbi:MAG TPA: DUF1465 family protein [Allosphingosinicella sp.]|nr:DUF1465 family protein [Allosphingosinicella sp.]
MPPQDASARMTPKLIDSLYVEAMLLADEARTYFDRDGRADRQKLDPLVRVSFSCESLKVTTRLMHVIAWLLTQRAVEAGESLAGRPQRPVRRLGHAAESDPDLLHRLPDAAMQLVQASCDLYARVQRLDEGGGNIKPQASPVRSLLSRLERSF